MTKLVNRHGGTNRALVILAILILVMVAVIYLPSWEAFRYRSECIACEQVMKTATDGLRIEYIDTFDESSIREARKTLDRVMPEREDICPAHGNVYLLKNVEGVFEPVCGLHDPDAARRTRLNASYAGDVLTEARKKLIDKASDGDFTEPESITIKVNNMTLECVYVSEEVNIKRGTSTTKDMEGIVAFYGTGDNGDIDYFVYADEDYCAIWHENDEWTGSAYTNR